MIWFGFMAFMAFIIQSYFRKNMLKLKDQTVLFLTILFSLSTSKYCNVSLTIQFNISHLFALFKCQTVLFNLYIGPYSKLPLWAKVNLEAMSVEEYFAFAKGRALLKQHLRLFNVISRTLVVVGGSYPLQRCSRCIQQLFQPTWSLVGGVLPLCRDVVGVFYSSHPISRPDYRLML